MAKMIRIGICGGPSSGKTILARALTNKLSLAGHTAEYAGEYARYHINMCTQNGIRGGVPEMVNQQLIFQNQLQWETSIPNSVEYMISDSPMFMQLVYIQLIGNLDNYVHRTFYCQTYEKMLELRDFYDYIFFLPSETEFKHDGTRSRDAERAAKIGERIRAFLVYHDYPFYEIHGLEDRAERCFEILRDKP